MNDTSQLEEWDGSMSTWDGKLVTSVFTRPDRTQILVTVYVTREGKVHAIEVAERHRQGDTWGPPIGPYTEA